MLKEQLGDYLEPTWEVIEARTVREVRDSKEAPRRATVTQTPEVGTGRMDTP